MDLDLHFEEANFDSTEGMTALRIYAQDLFLSESPEAIRGKLGGFVNTIYFSDSKVVGVTSVDYSEDYLGNAVLEYMAVDEAEQGQGLGGAILGIKKHGV